MLSRSNTVPGTHEYHFINTRYRSKYSYHTNESATDYACLTLSNIIGLWQSDHIPLSPELPGRRYARTVTLRILALSDQYSNKVSQGCR